MNIPKRHFYNNVDYTLDHENKVMILNKSFHEKLLEKKLWNSFGFKKIGGSMVGEVLETDDFKSQFAAFAKISWCGLPMLDKKYVNAGVAIEPMVIDVLRQKSKKTIQTFDPKEYNYDYFANKDDILGGIPDGFIVENSIILEIKTTGEKNYDAWNSFGVPSGYLKQAQIYSYLMDVEEYWIVAAFLKEDDYINPNNFPIKERKLKNYRFRINKNQVQDDINKLKKWYEKYTKLGISPKWDDRKDGDLIKYLECSNEEEYIKLLEQWKIEGKYVEE